MRKRIREFLILQWQIQVTYHRAMRHGVRVDPEHFPEDEFPVHCPKCRYGLQGLTSGVCPECGRPFERGRLLVCQYVIDRSAGLRPPVLVLSLLLLFCVAFSSWLFISLEYPALFPMQLKPYQFQIFVLTPLVLGVAAVGSTIPYFLKAMRSWPAFSKKSARILEALRRQFYH